MTTLPLGWIIFRGANFREFSLGGADSGSQFEMPVLSHLKYGKDCNAAGILSRDAAISKAPVDCDLRSGHVAGQV
jgi:hypothetical protein